MASEAHRLTSRLRFLQREVDILKAQLEHSEDELTSVTNRIAELLLAPVTDGDPPNSTEPTTPRSARKPPPTPSSARSGKKEVPDYNNDTPLAPGDRVMICVRGEYKGRRGTISKLMGNGKNMVMVAVDPIPPNTSSIEVRKAPTSLQRLRDAD